MSRLKPLVLWILLVVCLDAHALIQKPKPPAGSQSPTERLFMAVKAKDVNTVRTLLAAGADVTAKDAEDATPLYYAAESGSVELCNLLIDHKAKVVVPAGPPPLIGAIVSKNIDVVRLLLDKGADGVSETDDYDAPIVFAASEGSVPILQLLVDRGARFAMTSNGFTLLHIAAAKNAADAVAFLLDRGMDVNIRSMDGRTPILTAATAGAAKSLQVLIKRGAALDVKDEDGDTLLMLTAEVGSVEAVEALLARGVPVNVKNKIGRTALGVATASTSENKEKVVALLKKAGAKEIEPTLIEAVRQDDIRSVRSLLARGVDANETDEEGRTALHYAAEDYSDEKFLNALLEKGANPNARDRQGKAPVDIAKETGSRKTIDLLIAAGAVAPEIEFIDAVKAKDVAAVKRALDARININSLDEAGQTGLMIACNEKHMELITLLLERGANPNLLSNHGVTALMASVTNGDVEIVRTLLAKGADPNVASEYGMTAIMHVEEGPNPDAIARLLIEKGADIKAKTSAGTTVPATLARVVSDDTFRAVLEKFSAAEINVLDTRGDSPLIVAADVGSVGKVRLLLDRGADPNLSDPRTGSALNAAVRGRRNAEEGTDHLAAARLLIERGARLDVRDFMEKTPLDVATELFDLEMAEVLRKAGAKPGETKRKNELLEAIDYGDVYEVRALLKKGADANVLDEIGYSALVNACLRGNLEIVRLLLAHGAKPNLRGTGLPGDVESPSALMQAAEKGHVGIMKLLLQKGADPNARWTGLTPLMQAAGAGQVEACRLLLASGARINDADDNGSTALFMAAAMFVSPNVLKLLIAKGAKIEARNSLGWTPLIQATQWQNGRSARALLEAGADAKAAAKDGLTPLMGAAGAGDVGLVQLLITRGADVNARTSRNRTALTEAEDENHDAVVDLLKRAGAKP